MTDLKPCPFCGGRARVEKHKFSELPGTFSVRCTKCRAESWPFYGSEEDALRAWDMREEARHRPKTNGQKFKEVFGVELDRYADGKPAACPPHKIECKERAKKGDALFGDCDRCASWWDEPYEEPKEAK